MASLDERVTRIETDYLKTIERLVKMEITQDNLLEVSKAQATSISAFVKFQTETMAKDEIIKEQLKQKKIDQRWRIGQTIGLAVSITGLLVKLFIS